MQLQRAQNVCAAQQRRAAVAPARVCQQSRRAQQVQRLSAAMIEQAPEAPPSSLQQQPQSPLLHNIQFMNPAWGKVETEQQFFALLTAYLSKVPGGLEKLLPQWQDFYNNYRTAVTTSGVPGANELLVAKVQATIADTVTKEFLQPYVFPSKHERLLEPYNYFEFGQRYVSINNTR